MLFHTTFFISLNSNCNGYNIYMYIHIFVVYFMYDWEYDCTIKNVDKFYFIRQYYMAELSLIRINKSG